MHPDRRSPNIRRRGALRLGPSLLVAATLAIGILIGSFVSGDVDAAAEQAVAPDATPLVVPEPVPVENQFSGIARTVRPSVVNIMVETFRRRTSGQEEETDPSQMEDFFRRFFGMPDAPEEFHDRRRRPRPGEGSGVIVDPKGYIITNGHVVEGADRIRVRFDADEAFYDAKLIGSDDETDLAVIKVEADDLDLQAATIGNSEAVNVGDWAVAVGSPFGFRESVTVGIISAKSREVQSAAQPFSRPFQKFFQTDAAINPGNSGGPLLNIRGEVIGINTAIVSSSGTYQGLGFALPSNIAVRVYNQLIQYGRVTRGSIGIRFSGSQDPALLRTYGAENGVFVEMVTPGWPAEKAGMQPEDVIVEIDGEDIVDGDQLIAVVAAKPIGSEVEIEVIRDQEPLTLEVEIADREELLKSQINLPGETEEEEAEREAEPEEVDFGFTVQEIPASMREELGYDGDGVLITGIDRGSFADDLGLLEQDVIVAVNRSAVASIQDIRRIRDDLEPGQDVAFKVMRRIGAGEWRAVYLADVLPSGASSF